MAPPAFPALHSLHEIHLRWATRADIPCMATILHKNFLTFELFEHTAPRRARKPQEFRLFVLNRIKTFFAMANVRMMVAERVALDVLGTTQPEVIGYSAWEAQGEGNALRRAWMRQRDGWVEALERRLVRVEYFHHRYVSNTVVDYVAFGRVWGALRGCYDSVPEVQKSNLHLMWLMVDPEWQRGKGIGHMLLQWGLDVADQLGLPIVLESSLAGYKFYLRHGFMLLKTVRIDMVKEKQYDMPVVVREPRGREGEFMPSAET